MPVSHFAELKRRGGLQAAKTASTAMTSLEDTISTTSTPTAEDSAENSVIGLSTSYQISLEPEASSHTSASTPSSYTHTVPHPYTSDSQLPHKHWVSDSTCISPLRRSWNPKPARTQGNG
ncbi:hypothetical protein M501DRAFT_1014441 [Patellaria atrata CBS 101060]|uniref:Uncharacterized protein n=1 Tax=Patellaria atrata CBS 101060 TaxID=1346257 RepID=A0A9P4SF14_9PEZI|nr:hypothetical protein M501DRAFT_1014441 [Patellaria atrata CBS 101060]